MIDQSKVTPDIRAAGQTMAATIRVAIENFMVLVALRGRTSEDRQFGLSLIATQLTREVGDIAAASSFGDERLAEVTAALIYNGSKKVANKRIAMVYGSLPPDAKAEADKARAKRTEEDIDRHFQASLEYLERTLEKSGF